MIVKNIYKKKNHFLDAHVSVPSLALIVFRHNLCLVLYLFVYPLPLSTINPFMNRRRSFSVCLLDFTQTRVQ